ncbi:MAG: threonine--tRNA ligase [Erysipelotrichales bacterium]|nr:threonine--tRNA ligase [Erysipelotrichales bacterium]MBQ1385956.1 threonine--tRNA ligase [Erysipelotrichales bacterium]MBQ2310604.1 threonine--tRNA ligase [Erysipelotrichales bacterium]MBQ4374614.1 threonine--tRNA ligase [Erysipelotrichales bacterium]
MINIKENEDLHVLNHSCAHLLAQAVKHLYPQAKFWVGPVITDGFYYDMDLEGATINELDFPKIEKEMKKIAKDGKRIVRQEISREEALEKFGDDPYKVDLINNMPEDEVISCYTQGDFTDLCRGPHVASVKELKYFKLIKASGAYWKGDASNKMLQRVYGICFRNQEDLDNYLKYLEEAKLRDHRKIGKDMEIFMLSDLVGKGLPMWLPNGYTIWRTLQNYITDKEIEHGYLHVHTPDVGSVKLYKTSGHWDHYKDDMFAPMVKMTQINKGFSMEQIIKSIDEGKEDDAYVLRPMNCPHHMVLYGANRHSYRELPIRIAEVANDFRYEAQGAIKGIERARCFTQNDSHIFCTPAQIESEFKGVLDLIMEVYRDFGIKDYKCRLSLRDPADTEKYFPDDDMWNNAEAALRNVLNDLGIDYFEAIGEAAFYGPKLDVLVQPAIGNEVALSTIQLDFLLPRRFELEYVNENDEHLTPVVIHRAILGSLDRFVAFLLEETKGDLPLWLSPQQFTVIPVNPLVHSDYAKELTEKMRKEGFRVKLDNRNEKLGYRVREAQIKKVTVQVVIGDAEIENQTVTIRRHGQRESLTMGQAEFFAAMHKEIDDKELAKVG